MSEKILYSDLDTHLVNSPEAVAAAVYQLAKRADQFGGASKYSHRIERTEELFSIVWERIDGRTTRHADKDN